MLSLIQADPLSSLIHTTPNILFLVGTNSLRNFPATEVIHQLNHVLIFLFSHYSHLKQGKVVITNCLPCLKPSNRFSDISLLQNNIDDYNRLLLSLSTQHNFFHFDLHILSDWLGHDKLHSDYCYRARFANLIVSYINRLNVSHNTPIYIKFRSRQSISRRNKKRNFKLKQIQNNFTLNREISSVWSYTHLKNFLKLNGIRYGRLSIISNHTLRLHFNNLSYMLHADHALTVNILDSNNFTNWIQQNK